MGCTEAAIGRGVWRRYIARAHELRHQQFRSACGGFSKLHVMDWLHGGSNLARRMALIHGYGRTHGIGNIDRHVAAPELHVTGRTEAAICFGARRRCNAMT